MFHPQGTDCGSDMADISKTFVLPDFTDQTYLLDEPLPHTTPTPKTSARHPLGDLNQNKDQAPLPQVTENSAEANQLHNKELPQRMTAVRRFKKPLKTGAPQHHEQHVTMKVAF